MPSLPLFKKRFILGVLALISITFLTSLGFWQVYRAEEKRTMLAIEATHVSQPTFIWNAGNPNPKQYQRIQVTGRYLTDIYLLDNQHNKHQFGYNVISPLLLINNSVIFVDRGWIPGDVTRRQFPKLDTPTGSITITGVVYYPHNRSWNLGVMYEKKQPKLTIIEQLDIKLLQLLLQKNANPFIIRLNKDELHGFVREWAIVSMPPERHIAYAVQWFAMALVLFIIVIVLGCKRK